MPAEPQRQPSFSPHRRWGIGFHVGFLVCLVLSVVVMVNYLSRDYSTRIYLSAHTRNPLSPQTIKFLQTLTNQIQVTIYYQPDETYFTTVVDLLKEYHRVNPRVSVQVVDSTRDAAAAQQLKVKYEKYGFLAALPQKNVIIFDAGEGRVKAVDGDVLTQRVPEMLPDLKYRFRTTAFDGERVFTSTLATVINPRPLKVYFLQGHKEGQFDSGDEQLGYLKLASVIRENYAQVDYLSLKPALAVVPADCNLLVVAGPTERLEELELAKIDQYLSQAGHSLLVLLNAHSPNTGLERILAKWGVEVSPNVIAEPMNSASDSDVIVIADRFSHTHPIVNPLLREQMSLCLLSPLSIGQLRSATRAADAPPVEEIVFSSPESYVRGNPQSERRSYPLAVAVEKGAIERVVTGTTRLVVAGDSLFLANGLIRNAANRDFATAAINWLLDRPGLIGGLGPRPVADYTLVITKAQMWSLQWILLAGMPGAVLLLGTFVWFCRRS
jgi:hypothetical protein